MDNKDLKAAQQAFADLAAVVNGLAEFFKAMATSMDDIDTRLEVIEGQLHEIRCNQLSG